MGGGVGGGWHSNKVVEMSNGMSACERMRYVRIFAHPTLT